MTDPETVRAVTLDANVLLRVLASVKEGDFSVRMPLDWPGAAGTVADSLNEVIIANEALGAELARMGGAAGLSQRLALGGSPERPAAYNELVSGLMANMSHELRAPLSALLVLAQQLEENPENNMTARQVECASVIRDSGEHLLSLLNRILDVTKVETGSVALDQIPAGASATLPTSRLSTEDQVDTPGPVSDRRTQQPVTLARHGRHGPTGSITLSDTHVLVVDDDYRNLFAMTALLERSGAAVKVAESGAEAIALLERTSGIDIVLMDIMMPMMDGYEAIRAIRSNGRYQTVPIIVVTGKVMAGERERCLAVGANDYVPKPVNAAQLFTVLQPWVSLRRNLRDQGQAPPRRGSFT